MESYPRKLTLPGMVAERFTCGPPPSSSGPKKLDQGPRNPGPEAVPFVVEMCVQFLTDILATFRVGIQPLRIWIRSQPKIGVVKALHARWCRAADETHSS